jgi:hypothetical protein
VRDANGQSLAYVYSRANEAEAMQAKVLERHALAGPFLQCRSIGGDRFFQPRPAVLALPGVDAALNRGVARFAADPAAAAALKTDGDLTGVLPVPVVSIHSIYDPVNEVEVGSAYRDVVKVETPRRGRGSASPQAGGGGKVAECRGFFQRPQETGFAREARAGAAFPVSAAGDGGLRGQNAARSLARVNPFPADFIPKEQRRVRLSTETGSHAISS